MGIDASLQSDPKMGSLEYIKIIILTTTHTTELSKTTSFAHGLDFVPIILLELKVTSGSNIYYYPVPHMNMDTSNGSLSLLIKHYIDQNNIYIQEDYQSGLNVVNITRTYRAYIYRHQAN